MRESCFKGISFLYCSIMILKDTGQKGSVYRENSAQGNRGQACAGGLL